MCTVTWHRSRAGYELFFNRDELRSRGEALGPRVHGGAAPRFLAPVDGDFGGTWIAVSEAALTVGLLNGLPADPEAADEAPEERRSRGLLVRDLAPSLDLDDLERRLRSADLDRYPPFRVVALVPSLPTRVFEWDRAELVVDRDAEARLPLVSSSFEETEVGRARRAEFRATVGARTEPERLAAYHRSHANGPGARSVCMHRADAVTRSLTHVQVGPREVVLRYRPGSPCEDASTVSLRLARTAAPLGWGQDPS